MTAKNPAAALRTLALSTLFLAGLPAAADDLIYFDEDGGGGNPRGLYTLDPTTGVASLRTTVGGSERFFGITIEPATGKVFAVSVPGPTTGLWNLDVDTGVRTFVATINLNTIADIDFDPTTGIMYGQERNDSFRIFKIDPANGAFSLLGAPGQPARCGLVFSPQGQMYAFSIDGVLFSIDKNTGLATLIGGAPDPGIQIVEDATFTDDGELYFTAWPGRVYQVDPATGSRRPVHTTGMGTGCLGIIPVPGPTGCYPDCDTTTGVGVLDIFDFLCFQNRYDAGSPYACDCDTSTGPGVCDIFDFLCFQNAYDAGCP